MQIFIFGNPDIETDSLPLRILDRLRVELPDVDFQVKDPNEEWDIPKELIIIDTVVGIDNIQVFDNLDIFQNSPRYSLHGFDALMNLQLLKKLGKLKEIKIIGIPPAANETDVIKRVVSLCTTPN